MNDQSKVGSDPAAADAAVGKKDFGVHEDDVVERTYVSEETKRSDPGKAVERSGTGPRDSGVGANDSGPGSGSGGDIDVGGTALTGVADPNQHPPHGKSPAATGPRETLDPPVIDNDPARAGTLDNDSSTSAADVTNETQRDGNANKSDLTADEAGGNSSK